MGAISILSFLIALCLPTVRAVTLYTRAYCDRCHDGGFTASDSDYSLLYKKLNATCIIQKGSSSITATFSGKTDGSGNIAIGLVDISDYLGEASLDAAFNAALFVGGDYSQGQLADARLTGCTLRLKCATCSTNLLNDGKCGATAGNGWTTDVKLEPSSDPTVADIVTQALCYGLPAKPNTCPAPPPPSPPPSGTGDPHFTGADGSHFDFSGEPDKSFCLLTDSHLHINVFYAGRYGQWGNSTTPKALTWIRQIGILWGHHTVVLQAREGSTWQYGSGYMNKIAVDGEEVKLSQPGEDAELAEGEIVIRWLAAKFPSGKDFVDVYEVKIGSVVVMRLTLRPEIAMLRTNDDGLVHFDFELPVADLSENAHGILGQTFRSDHRDRLPKQKLVFSELLQKFVVPGDNAEGFLDGKVSDYTSSGLLRSDCRFSRFIRATRRDSESAKALETSSGFETPLNGFGGQWRLPVTSS